MATVFLYVGLPPFLGGTSLGADDWLVLVCVFFAPPVFVALSIGLWLSGWLVRRFGLPRSLLLVGTPIFSPFVLAALLLVMPVVGALFGWRPLEGEWRLALEWAPWLVLPGFVAAMVRLASTQIDAISAPGDATKAEPDGLARTIGARFAREIGVLTWVTPAVGRRDFRTGIRNVVVIGVATIFLPMVLTGFLKLPLAVSIGAMLAWSLLVLWMINCLMANRLRTVGLSGFLCVAPIVLTALFRLLAHPENVANSAHGGFIFKGALMLYAIMAVALYLLREREASTA